MLAELRTIPLWSVASVVALAAPSWAAVAVCALLLVRDGTVRFLAHQERLKQSADTDRLVALEREVRSLSQAIQLKNLGRG